MSYKIYPLNISVTRYGRCYIFSLATHIILNHDVFYKSVLFAVVRPTSVICLSELSARLSLSLTCPDTVLR